MRGKSILYFLTIMALLPCTKSAAQKKSNNLIYIDKQGVFRYTKNKKEAIFFGVNYTMPFAYGYRSHKALGIDLEKAIDADVYHMARLGLDAFRVHVWDVDISDSLGNLLQNEHLRLFDYLVKKLKERNIKLLITPIAFWGNGYPEPDIKTIGFASVYGKRPSVTREEAFRAQERYLQQFLAHVNPYTALSYKDDPDVIAMEINNEPQHSGPKERTTEYVQRMKAAVRSTGWTKPIFYNISESPTYADAVVKGNVDGHSFQWYPTGLVANREIKGNFLPNVDQYAIPFGDTIPAFKNKARMVYEFDAGDVAQPVMYPAMARSYRTAGFGWATQFAYDPLYTAYANTEYQTHYLNLAYTPAKAISLLIASKAFHNLPLAKRYGTYPADTIFGDFRVSYRQGLSEMNSTEEFYYTGSTGTLPKAATKLKHIAGVGSSAMVAYEGTGAYFLDKIAKGVWRLEVMPDVISVKDPFEKASPKKAVTGVQWSNNKMQIRLGELGENFRIKKLSDTNSVQTASGTQVYISPGIYLITNAKTPVNAKIDYSFPLSIGMNDFYAPPASITKPLIVHTPISEVTADKAFMLTATAGGIDSADAIMVEMHNGINHWKTLPMVRNGNYAYSIVVPKELVTPGVINYRMFIKRTNGEVYVFPGGFEGDPYAWDEYRSENWQTFVAQQSAQLELFNATIDRKELMVYNPDWRSNTIDYTAAAEPHKLVVRTTMKKPAKGQLMGWQFFFGDKIKGRVEELSRFSKLVVRVRGTGTAKASIALITKDGDAFGAELSLTSDWKDVVIPFSMLKKTRYLLLPRPYPGFQPLWFTSEGTRYFNMGDSEKIELYFEGTQSSVPIGIEIEWIRLDK